MSSTEKPEEVKSEDALASFLFDLIRDCVPFGEVERILEELEEVNESGLQTYVFTNPDVGKYAIGLANRIHRLNIARRVPT